MRLVTGMVTYSQKLQAGKFRLSFYPSENKNQVQCIAYPYQFYNPSTFFNKYNLDFSLIISYNPAKGKDFPVKALIHQTLTVTRPGTQEVAWFGDLNRPHF